MTRYHLSSADEKLNIENTCVRFYQRSLLVFGFCFRGQQSTHNVVLNILCSNFVSLTSKFPTRIPQRISNSLNRNARKFKILLLPFWSRALVAAGAIVSNSKGHIRNHAINWRARTKPQSADTGRRLVCCLSSEKAYSWGGWNLAYECTYYRRITGIFNVTMDELHASNAERL